MQVSNLDKNDEVAASLVKLYQRDGEFCVVIRTDSSHNNMRVIMPQIDATVASEFMRKAADSVFDGNIKTLYRIQ